MKINRFIAGVINSTAIELTSVERSFLKKKMVRFLVRSSFACVELSENILRLLRMISTRHVALYGIETKISVSHMARQ